MQKKFKNDEEQICYFDIRAESDVNLRILSAWAIDKKCIAVQILMKQMPVLSSHFAQNLRPLSLSFSLAEHISNSGVIFSLNGSRHAAPFSCSSSNRKSRVALSRSLAQPWLRRSQRCRLSWGWYSESMLSPTGFPPHPYLECPVHC